MLCSEARTKEAATNCLFKYVKLHREMLGCGKMGSVCYARGFAASPTPFSVIARQPLYHPHQAILIPSVSSSLRLPLFLPYHVFFSPSLSVSIIINKSLYYATMPYALVQMVYTLYCGGPQPIDDIIISEMFLIIITCVRSRYCWVILVRFFIHVVYNNISVCSRHCMCRFCGWADGHCWRPGFTSHLWSFSYCVPQLMTQRILLNFARRWRQGKDWGEPMGTGDEMWSMKIFFGWAVGHFGAFL